MAFLAVVTKEGAKGEKMRENPNFLSMIQGVPSVGILQAKESKFIYSTRATCTYQKGRISSKIQRKRFKEIKDLGLRRLPTRAIMLQEVGFFLLWFISTIRGLI